MAKMMPVAIKDHTSDFIMQMAQGNQALARLYTQLLARYEERKANEEFQREMYGYKSADADKRAAESDQRWYNRADYMDWLRNGGQAPQGPNLLGPGAGSSSVAAPSISVPAPQAAAPVQRPSVYSLPNPYDTNSQGAGAKAPAVPARQSSNAGAPGMNDYAQGSAADLGTSGATDFSSQSRSPMAEPPRTGTPSLSTPPRPFRREPTSITQLPTQPRVTPRTAATRPQADYLDIAPQWLDLMHQQEDKYGLPRGSLMTLYGVENGGGRVFGKNKSGSAEGIYQFHQALRAEHGLTDEDTRNPAKMIPAAAYNLRRNADILEQNYKIKLPNTPETIPVWVALHQWGAGAGPRIVASYMQNPDAPMISVMGTHKDAKGNVIPNYNVLAANNIDPTWSVKQAIQSNKGSKWLNSYIQQFPDHANQPVGTYQSTPPPARQDAQPDVGGPVRPVTGRYGVNPNVEQFINDIRARYPQIRVTSGYRDPVHNANVGGSSRSQHMHRTAFDASLTGLTPDQKHDVIVRARAAGAMGIGNYGGDSIHLDWRRGGPVAWGPNRSNTSLYATPSWFRSEAVAHLSGRPPAQPADIQQPRQAQPQQPQQSQQPQKPVKVAGPPMYPEVTPALSRIPTDAEFNASMQPPKTNPFGDEQIPLPRSKPPIPPTERLPPGIVPAPDVMAGAPTSDPYSQVPPDVIGLQPSALGQGAGIRPDATSGTTTPPPFPEVTEELPVPPPRPSEGGDLGTGTTPADTKLPGDDYGSFFETPMPQRRPIEPEITPPDRSNEGTPVALNNAIFNEPTPPELAAPDMPPQPPPGVIPKDPLPPEFASVTPRGGVPDMTAADVPPSATARAPLPPEFKMPLPALDGGAMSAGATAPTNPPMNELKLPPRLPPELPKSPVDTPANTPGALRTMIDAIYGGKLPNMGTAADPTANNSELRSTATQYANQIGDAYDNRPSLQQVGEWLKQNFGPGAAPDRQKAFHQAVREYMKKDVTELVPDALKQWWNKPSGAQGQPPTPAPAAPPPPARTMPNGSPYIVPPEPLVVPLPKGKGGPTNTTLSAPQQGSAPMPALPGKINPLTGRPDIPMPVKQPDGTVLYTEPGETVQEGP